MASLAGSGGGSNLKVGAHGERGAPAYKGIWGRSPQRGPGADLPTFESAEISPKHCLESK